MLGFPIAFLTKLSSCNIKIKLAPKRGVDAYKS